MEKASFNVFLATIVCAILAFAAPTFLPLAAVKTAVIGIGVLFSFILFLIARLKAKSIDLPWSPLSLAGVLAGLSVGVSSVLSSSPYSSFLGKSFGANAGLFIIVLFVAAFLGYALVQTKDRVFIVYTAALGSFSLIALFHLIRFIFNGSILSLGFFTTLTTTMVGSWYDFGIFAGFVFILSFLILQILAVARTIRIVAMIFFGLSALFLIIIGSSLVSAAVAFVMTVVLVRGIILKIKKAGSGRKGIVAVVPIFSFIVCVLTIAFAWQGTLLTKPLADRIKANYAEVSLPWQYTLDVTEPTLKAVPFFGAGPDRFTNAYLQFKPEAVNATQFWSIDFPSGSNYILTTIVTQGLVGFSLWIAFIILFFIGGIRALASEPKDNFSMFILESSFFGGTFLWLMTLLYVPSHVLLLLAFVVTGLFVGELVHMGIIRIKKVEVNSAGKGHILPLIVIAVAIVGSVIGIALFAKETIGQMYFQSGLQTINSASSASTQTTLAIAARAKTSFQSAASWNKVDTNYQALAQVDIFTVNALVASATSTSDTTLATSIGSLITEGIAFARTAEQLDPSNSYNYITEANMSEVAAGLRIQNGYENARAAYGKALQISPLNPSIYLSLAKLDYFAGSTTAATVDLNAALQLKSDYTDALYEAGVISYDQKDYQTAEAAFAQTLRVDGTYVNAAYFLSLTLVRLGDTKDAIAELTSLALMYPDNQQIAGLISTLKAGGSPFGNPTLAAPTPASPTASTSTSSTLKSKAKH